MDAKNLKIKQITLRYDLPKNLTSHTTYQWGIPYKITGAIIE